MSWDVRSLEGEWVATCVFRTDAAQLKWSFANPEMWEVVPHVESPAVEQERAGRSGDTIPVSRDLLKRLMSHATAMHHLHYHEDYKREAQEDADAADALIAGAEEAGE